MSWVYRQLVLKLFRDNLPPHTYVDWTSLPILLPARRARRLSDTVPPDTGVVRNSANGPWGRSEASWTDRTATPEHRMMCYHPVMFQATRLSIKLNEIIRDIKVCLHDTCFALFSWRLWAFCTFCEFFMIQRRSNPLNYTGTSPRQRICQKPINAWIKKSKSCKTRKSVKVCLHGTCFALFSWRLCAFCTFCEFFMIQRRTGTSPRQRICQKPINAWFKKSKSCKTRKSVMQNLQKAHKVQNSH